MIPPPSPFSSSPAVPSAVPFIDSHTHGFRGGAGTIRVLNAPFPAPPPEIPPELSPNTLLCAGIHPACAETAEFDALENYLDEWKCRALGECGVDRSCAIPETLQMELFMKHAACAEKRSLPLVIHCVRAYSELIAAAKRFRRERPWLVHGFRGNAKIASELHRHGFFLSLSAKAVLGDPSFPARFRNTPFLLETDGTGGEIEHIYEVFAQRSGMDGGELRERTLETFGKVFGNVL